MKRTPWWLAAALVLVTACQNRQQAAEEVLKKVAAKAPGLNAGSSNFDIATPAGWTRSDTTLNGVRVTLLRAPVTGMSARSSVNVVSEDMGPLPFEKYFETSVENISKYMQNYHLEGKGDKDIGGIASKYIQYTQSPGGLNLEAVCYCIPSNGVAYIITCTTAQGHLQEYQAQFDAILQSFHVH